MTWRDRMAAVLAPALIDKVPRDHRQPDTEFWRRRLVVLVFLALGATLLGLSLDVTPGDPRFYPMTLLLAATWCVGGLLSGPLHVGRIPFNGGLRPPVLTPIVLGVLAGGLFAMGALVVRQIPPLAGYVDDVLAHADAGPLPLIALITLANGIAEEVFFRGGLFAAIGRRHPVVISTAVYAVATVTTLNPMLVFAALVLGLLLALQRRASGGILGPVLTHVTWSSTMLFLLPPLFA
ncbi:MAG: type II CAAX prenyl endopeptidase Rce1 family protein [Actinomycetales bacterium]